MPIRFVRTHDEMEPEIDRLVRTTKLRAELTAIAEHHFAESDALVHVHPPGGSYLKASGRVDIENFPDRWSGELSWGGEWTRSGDSPGRAAHFELERGEDHSAFYDRLYLYGEDVEEAIADHLRGGRLG